jgi:UDP-N-acetyl-2-amino-2-deoxyglucuronate dehydrogenase
VKNFVLIGAAGYIAPRHMRAIKETGNRLVAALDPHDSVGILDNYFPDCDFFTEFERFDRHCEKLKRNGIPIDYVVVCSPNYLHDAHCRFGLRIGADVICEKPVVLTPGNLEGLSVIEKETGKKVYCIMQLRLHPAIAALKEQVRNNPAHRYNVNLTYITPRGSWYHYSWKGNESKSGGVLNNIGIHFFDMLIWVFGGTINYKIENAGSSHACGSMELTRADVKWKLGIERNMMPPVATEKQLTGFRLLTTDDKEVNLSSHFDELHTKSYQEILKGIGLDEVAAVTELISNLRGAAHSARSL